MNAFARRDQILDEFRRASNGSFSVVYRALTEISSEKKTADLTTEDVKGRIREIVKQQEPAHNK